MPESKAMPNSGADLTLVLNTAEKHVQFLLLRRNEMLCAQTWLAGRGGAELLAPALQAACGILNCGIEKIGQIACVAGPGNFTGLRIGLTTASGLSLALGAKQAGLNYLQCLAANVQAAQGEPILVLTRARSGLAYCGLFTGQGNAIPSQIRAPFLVDLEKAPEEAFGRPAFALGSAAAAAARILPSSCRILPCPVPSFDALALCTGGLDWENAGYADIAPLYMRDCDAVENLPQIAAAQGRTLSSARQELDTLTHKDIAEGYTASH